MLGLHVGPHAFGAALLGGDAMQARTCVAAWSWPASTQGPAALSDPILFDQLHDELTARDLHVHTLAVVFETDAFVRDTVVMSDDASDSERLEDLRIELLARHPALGAQPRWTIDDDALMWALPQARWQEAQALAEHLGATLELIGHADAARTLAAQHAHAEEDPAAAALGAALGAWHGLQPQWWPTGPHRRRRRWLDLARHTARASGLGAVMAALGLSVVQIVGARVIAPEAATPTLAELEQDLSRLQAERAQWQARAQRAQQHQRRLEAAQRQRQHRQQVLRATVSVPGLWLASVSQQDDQWQWQGEAVSPAAAQQLLRALTASGPWRQAPQVLEGRWQTGRDAAATVWAFRIQAQSEGP